jgi:hypothetical protein
LYVRLCSKRSTHHVSCTRFLMGRGLPHLDYGLQIRGSRRRGGGDGGGGSTTHRAYPTDVVCVCVHGMDVMDLCDERRDLSFYFLGRRWVYIGTRRVCMTDQRRGDQNYV